MSTSTTLLRVVLLADGERVDIAVTPDARLADVLHTAGINASAAMVTTPEGRRIDLEAPLADEVTEGQILSVAPKTPLDSAAARPTGSRPGRYQRLPAAATRWGMCALGVALAAVAVLTHLATMGSPSAYPQPVAAGMPILLAALAVVLGVRQAPPVERTSQTSAAASRSWARPARRPGDPAMAEPRGHERPAPDGASMSDSPSVADGASRPDGARATSRPDGARTTGAAPMGARGVLVETVLAPIFGFAAGFLVADPAQYGAPRLAVVLGLLSGAVVAVLRFAVSRRAQDPTDGIAAVLAGVWTATAGLFAVEFLLGLPAYVAPSLVLGATPLVIRAMPGAALDISEEQVLDMPFLARTAMSVRGVLPKSPGRVRPEHVARRIRQAENRERAGMIAASVLVAATTPAVLAGYEPGGLPGWGTVALIGLIVVFLTLAPRSFRRLADKLPPRVALFTVLAQLALGAHRFPDLLTWGIVALVVAVGFAYLAVPIARGYRSVRFSRLGDIVEGLAVGLAMPAALVAAGAVQGLQTVTGG